MKSAITHPGGPGSRGRPATRRRRRETHPHQHQHHHHHHHHHLHPRPKSVLRRVALVPSFSAARDTLVPACHLPSSGVLGVYRLLATRVGNSKRSRAPRRARGKDRGRRTRRAEDRYCDLYYALVLPVMLLAGPSEEFFLEYPKKALKEFFQSLKEKKLPPKTSHMQHYHIHYYPVPFPLLAWKAPDKHYLDELYDDTRASFGWSDYRYNYAPEPSLILPSDLQQLWDDPLSEDGPGTDGAFDSIDRNSRGILVQVPVNRPVVFQLLRRSRQRRMDTAMT